MARIACQVNSDQYRIAEHGVFHHLAQDPDAERFIAYTEQAAKRQYKRESLKTALLNRIRLAVGSDT
ncbi:MAG: hypothetical protein EB027_01685 [Actinobacteria bacterium]|nr:hypothetical protein [Actinomycetota bacterium]